jgi:uncharacterized protein
MVMLYTLERAEVARTEEIVFAGDWVRLSGQIDYPHPEPYQTTFPLLFVLHHAGYEAREGYQHLVDCAMQAGYAIFRWDKRGTGRSGASGRGSTTQDAAYAYETALSLPHVDRRHVVVMAQDASTGMLGNSFGLFARIQHPYGVVLATNTLDEETVQAIDSRLLILMGQQDWNPWQYYARTVSETHKHTAKHGSSYYVAPFADRMLYDVRDGLFHAGVQNALQDWLQII